LSVDKTTALIKGANSFASVVLPTPGRPQKSIITNNHRNELVIFNISVKLALVEKYMLYTICMI
jgi:hypothetical protein